MKINYKQLVDGIKSRPSINELSKILFQLGHEHEIQNNIFDFEFTPNKGDCLSIRGLLRELNSFYDVEIEKEIYIGDIKTLNFDFQNNVKDFCPKISFLKVEIDEIPNDYCDVVEAYFKELDIKKNNFFTDLSNYINYETGQPTHCYDNNLIKTPIILDELNDNYEYESLIDKKLNLEKKEIVFMNKNREVINLAGIIGGKSTACSETTTSVLIECAYFNPEMIQGKTVRYAINSDAAYKFERNTDPSCHEYVLRRFLKLIEEHSKIINVELFTYNDIKNFTKKIDIEFDYQKINKILGIEISCKTITDYLKNLGFSIKDNKVLIPDHRHDIESLNDIAEEVARVIGYDNIKSKKFKISKDSNDINHEEKKIRNLLINNGFYEVINDPFTSTVKEKSIKVDNPLDSNKKYLRTNLKDALLENLLFNERRQKDSIKLFEIADIYTSTIQNRKKVLGIIASGRVDKNYEDFSKKIQDDYFKHVLNKIFLNISFDDLCVIPRENLNSKRKDPIYFIQIELDSVLTVDCPENNLKKDFLDYKYIPISDFPLSVRDLSFSIKDYSSSEKLQEYLLNYKNKLLKEVFIFDYFFNENSQEIKIGFRLVFQDTDSTITENQVNDIMDAIIDNTMNFKGITIPGLK